MKRRCLDLGKALVGWKFGDCLVDGRDDGIEQLGIGTFLYYDIADFEIGVERLCQLALVDVLDAGKSAEWGFTTSVGDIYP